MPTKGAVKQNFSALSRQKKREIFAGKRHLFPLAGVRELVGAHLSPSVSGGPFLALRLGEGAGVVSRPRPNV